MGVDVVTILDFDRDTMLTERYNKIDLRLRSSLGKMRQIQVRQSAEEIPHDTLSQVAR